ncbi:MAG: hypothetical protein M1820_008859 [Bogoriella megaspora]|nr:MAG: hypothetical protein M1820_008859 [Bogoriella megaspora]
MVSPGPYGRKPLVDVGPMSLRGRRRFGRLLKLILTTTTLVLISASALYASFSWDYYIKSPWKYVPALAPSRPLIPAKPDVGPLDIVLHPEDHVYRKPKTQHLNWTISSGVQRPDGVAKLVYLINGGFPGPTIEARAGDVLEINVHNTLTDNEGLAIHWHGLHMRGGNQYDGAIGFTQCPIPAGGNFTYRFEISETQHGTFWYHSHAQTQRADGLYGGLVVHKPAHTGADGRSQKLKYDEERLVLVSDLYHRAAAHVLTWYMRADSNGMEPVPDSLLVNGVGTYNCSLAMPAYPVDCAQRAATPGMKFDSQKKYRIRAVNTGSLAGVTMTMPGANMTAVEVDGGHKINPKPAASVGILHPGQRVDIALSWDPSISHARSGGFEIALDKDSFLYSNPALNPTQTCPVHLTNLQAPIPNIANGTALLAPVIPVESYFDLSTATALRPWAASYPPLVVSPANTIVLYTNTLMLAHQNNVPMGYINHTSWRSSSAPLILQPRTYWENGTQFVPFIPYSDHEHAFVDIVINNLDDSGHPFHLHGYDFDILASWGVNSKSKSYGSFNPFATVAPQKSTATTKPSSTASPTTRPAAISSIPATFTTSRPSYSTPTARPSFRTNWRSKRSMRADAPAPPAPVQALRKRSTKPEHVPPPGGPLNLVNPARRDTVYVPRHGYAVIRIKPDNPGIWMLHCHLLWHQSAGMAMGLQVGGDQVNAFAGEEWRGVKGLCAA